MAVVIRMSDHKPRVPPKRETHRFGKHTVIVTFQPTAPMDQRWSWVLRYVSEQVYVGSDKDIKTALKKAQQKIEERDGRNDNRRSK